MAGTYTVQSVERSDQYDFEDREKPGQRVYLTAYELRVSGEQTNGFDPVTDTLWVNRKRETPPPAPGEELHVDVEKKKRGWTGKNAARRDQGQFAGSSNAGYRNPPTPEEEARMRHTSALSAAPAYIEQMLTIGAVKQPESKDDYVQLVEGVVTWLEGTYPVSSV